MVEDMDDFNKNETWDHIDLLTERKHKWVLRRS